MGQDNNKRIAKNTFLLYFRMIFVMLVSLYTSRKILDVLGVNDYGIYNVVGGVVSMFGFLNGSLSVATQRFLTYEIGRNDLEQLKKVFGASCLIHYILAIIIFILLETLGLWFLNNKMNIPIARVEAANWVFHTSMIAMTIGVIQTPYTASITAHERMDVFAYIGIVEAVLKLTIVLLLSFISFDKLKLYGVLCLSVQLIIMFSYRIFCFMSFPECRVKVGWDKSMWPLLTFTGWNIFGTLAWMLKDQGSNILMNVFGGPAINAARGVAGQIAGALKNMVSGFQTAVNPQLTKTYAAGSVNEMLQLLCTSSKISFYLLYMICLPFLFETEYILDLWLVKVPQHSALFTRLITIEILIDSLCGPMITSLMATGEIKWYQIVVGSILLLTVPLSYVMLFLGAPIYTPLLVSLLLMSVALIARLFFLKEQVGLPYVRYFREVISPIIKVIITSMVLPVFFYMVISNMFLRVCLVFFASLLSVLLCSYILGLNDKERLFVRTVLNSFLKKIMRWERE